MRRALIAVLLLLPAAAVARAESDYHAFVDDYIEFLGSYADAGTDEDVRDLTVAADAMPSDDPWLRQTAKTLSESAEALATDPAASAEGVLRSSLYLTKGLSVTDAGGKGLRHRLTKPEREDLLRKIEKLESVEWIRANKTVMTVAKILSSFLKSETIGA